MWAFVVFASAGAAEFHHAAQAERDMHHADLATKLAAARHTMELSRTHEDSEIKKDGEKLANLDRKLDAEEGQETNHERKMREKFEAKIDASEEAFAHKLKKQEEKTEEQSSNLMKDFADKMSKSDFRRPATSYLQTSESPDDGFAKVEAKLKALQEKIKADTAKFEQEAKAAPSSFAQTVAAKDAAGGKDADSALAAARVEDEARQAAQARLGSHMRDMLASLEDGSKSRKLELEGDRAEEHRKLALVKAGLQKEELKLKASATKEVAQRAALAQKLAAGDAGFEQKLHAHEEAFEAKTKAMRESFAAKYKSSDAEFNKHEHETEQVLADAFNFRGN